MLTGESNRASTDAPDRADDAAAAAESLVAAGPTRVSDDLGEAEGRRTGRQMQATPGHWRSLTDTRKRLLARDDSLRSGTTDRPAEGFDSPKSTKSKNAI